MEIEMEIELSDLRGTQKLHAREEELLGWEAGKNTCKNR